MGSVFASVISSVTRIIVITRTVTKIAVTWIVKIPKFTLAFPLYWAYEFVSQLTISASCTTDDTAEITGVTMFEPGFALQGLRPLSEINEENQRFC